MLDQYSFNFAELIQEDQTYKLLFPEREIGLAIIALFEKIENGIFEDNKFTEKDIHDAFEKIHATKERYPKEIFSEHIMNLQEFFLDYDQQAQKYYFKDYAYKFCKHAKETLKGAFNPTRIQKLCTYLSTQLKNTTDLEFWLTEEFPKYEPDLREQVDFLDRQISLSINYLKKETNLTGQRLLDVLISTEERLNQTQLHIKELRSAYSETKTIRSILDSEVIRSLEINLLISRVYSSIKYINDRLQSIDTKLDRIQPKIRQLFSNLNKPTFNLKIEKFILFLLNNSEVKNNTLVLPKGIQAPILNTQIPKLTSVNRNKAIFPPKPQERKIYLQNEKIISNNKQKIIEILEDIDQIKKWESYIITEINLKKKMELSEVFFNILSQTNNQIAITIFFNVIKYVRTYSTLFRLDIDKSIKSQENISTWKISITRLG